jgi:hypothetical protein
MPIEEPMVQSFPPPGFVRTESAVEGIELYQPAPPEAQEKQREVVAFKCPHCGAGTAYSAADGALTCTHCGYYEPPHKEVVGKAAQAFEFTVETLERAAHGWGQTRNELQCQDCGAYTSTAPDSLTHTCPFCASHKVIQRKALQDNLRPRFLIPFTIEAGKCQQIAHEWLGSSWMTPGSLHRLAKVAGFTGIYLSFWTFDAVTNADWKAEVAHTETEQYFDSREMKYKTRTKTVWKWESGHVQLVLDDLLVPGTSRLSHLLLGQLRDYDLSQLAVYEPSYLAGFQAQAYDLPLEAAWEKGRHEMRERTREACCSQASNSHMRNFSMNLNFKDESWRYVLLPVYIAAYQYQDKTYQVMVNGQTGAIAGQRPVSWLKVGLVIAMSLAPGLLVGLVGVLTLLLGGVGLPIGVVGFVLLLIGLGVSAMLVGKAQTLDDI